MSYTKVLLYLFVIIAYLPLKAQQNIDSLRHTDILNMSIEELLKIKVKVSSTIPTSIFDSPSNVTIIEREQIDQYNFLSVAEAVRQVAGVEMLQTVIDKNVPTIRGILQNFYANKVLIMIDNIPIWNSTNGNSTLDRISINDVERIEVLKGPASVLYGTNAYNGVINIIRRGKDDSEIHAQIDGGYPNLGAASVNYFNKTDDFSWNISINSAFESREPYLVNGTVDTFKIDDSYLFENDTTYLYREQYSNYNINALFKYKAHSVYVNNFTNSYTHPGVNVSYQTGANKTVYSKGTIISYTFEKDLNSKTRIKFNTHYDHHFRNQVIRQAQSISAQFSSQRIATSIKVNHLFTDYFKLEYGGEVFEGKNLGHDIVDNTLDTVILKNIDKGSKIIEGSLFSQALYSYKGITVIGGARYTYNKNFGSNLSPRFTAMFKLNSKNNIKFIYGKSFRTPNLFELYMDHPTIVGNTELKPETCTTYEIVYNTKSKYYFVQLTTYYSDYDNLIQRTRLNISDSDPAEHINLGSFVGVGSELEVKYQNNRIINALFSYNYMQGIGDEAESNFKYIPMHTVAFGLNKSIKAFFISANSYSYSKVEGTWDDIPLQFMLDAHVGYKHKSAKGFRLIHTISLKNITNSDMFIPEYIRNRPQINTLATTGYGRRFIYTLKLAF